MRVGLVAAATGAAYLLTVAASTQPFQATEEPADAPVGVDFVADVMPVLTAAGCNTGGCHGAALGQNRFKLSLLGYDPRADWEAITRDLRGRRIQRVDPVDSLILRKPSGRADHVGGVVLPPDSEGYAILRAWLEAGAPYRTSGLDLDRIEVQPAGEGDRIELSVVAHYTDGSRRDVTRWSGFETNDDSVAWIEEDTSVVELLRPGQTSIIVRYGGEIEVWPVTIPFGTVDLDYEPRNFVDELVAAQWRRMGIEPPEPCSDVTFLRRATLDLTGRLPTIDEQLAFERRPDRGALVDRLIASDAFDEYWAYRLSELFPPSERMVGWLRNGLAADRSWDAIAGAILTAKGGEPGVALFHSNDPKQIAENLFESFLGKQIQCAQCHNHPFMSFTQDDYFGAAAFFARVRMDEGELELAKRGEVRTIDTGETVLPAFPGGAPIEIDADADRRPELAAWVVAQDDFATLMANRVWAALLGTGLVEPVEDLRPSNPASNGPLLEALAEHFRDNGQNLRALVGAIAQSDAYGRLKQPRLLRAEVLVDAIAQATGVADAQRAVQRPTMASPTLDVSGRRVDHRGSLAQALHLITSDAVNAKVAAMESMDLEAIYRRALGRPPTAAEAEFAPANREELEDLMWALLNSEEFMYVR